MNANAPHEMNEELMTRWIDGQLSPEEQASMDRLLAVEPSLNLEKQSALQLGGLLRSHLPAALEPPSPDFFTSRIMDEIRSAPSTPVAKNIKAKAASSAPSFWTWLRRPWLAPLISAAAVAVVFLAVDSRRPDAGGGTPVADASRIYAPDPNVVAKAYFSNSADATVIDLEGLQPVPDDREIRAFDLASAEPPAPGQPQVFYSASGPDRAKPVLTVATGGSGGAAPRLKDLH
ncbi:MAG: hypothetical protein JWM59_4697 [Verrucomicrobiales bacterium]|nr:hypothetical protein [Verrucomicrobiales bacterium]